MTPAEERKFLLASIATTASGLWATYTCADAIAMLGWHHIISLGIAIFWSCCGARLCSESIKVIATRKVQWLAAALTTGGIQ